MRAVVVAVTVACMIGAGCARPWPAPRASADIGFAQQQVPVGRIDVLPIDLAVWTNGKRDSADTYRAHIENDVLSAATAAIYQHGYQVGAVIDWNGTYQADDGSRQQALAPGDLFSTVEVLSGYGLAVADRGGLPQPPLPARLGGSGADATLYVGGWAYVGDDTSTGAKVAKVAAITILVVVAVVVIVALARDHGGGGGSALGHAAGGVAKVVSASGRAAAHGLAHAGNVAVEVGKAGGHLLENVARATPRAAARALDAMSRMNLDIEVSSRSPYAPYGEPAWQPSAPPPAWDARPGSPHHGRSSMYLEMTLVDNRDGRVLWHARQLMPASGARDAEVQRAAAILLATLPRAR